MCDKVILLIRFYYLFVHVENQRKESYKSACKERDGPDHWYFSSVAQVTLAAVDLAVDLS